MPQIKVLQQLTKTNLNIVGTVAGDPVVLDGATTFSAQIVSTGTGFDAHIFDNGTQAELSLQDIDYTSVDRGGNAITIAYTGGGTAGAEVVSVVSDAISVQIQNGVSTADDIVTAIENSVPASDLVTCVSTGSDGTITWTNLTDAAFSGMTGILQKTGGGADWNAGAFSSSVIATKGNFSFRVLASGVSKGWSGGLSATNPAGDFNVPAYSFLMDAATWQVVESGSGGLSGPHAYATNDILEIRVAGGVVGYYQNNVLIYTSLVSYPGNLYPTVCAFGPESQDLGDEFLLTQGQVIVSATHLTGGVDSDVDADTSTIEITGHGYQTGLLVTLTSTGTLPDGLAPATDYYVIVIDADHIQLAATVDDALAGIPISITTEGSEDGVDTITPTVAAGSCTFQLSNDALNVSPVNWTNAGGGGNLLGADPLIVEKAAPLGNWGRIRYTTTAGSISATAVIVTKGPN